MKKKTEDQLIKEIQTLRKRIRGLKKTRAAGKAAMESTADGILTVDRKGKILDFNEKFMRLWNIPPKTAEKGDDGDLIQFVLDQLEDPGSFMDRIRELYEDQEAESLDEILFKDGRVFERYSLPLHIDGKPTGRVWSFRDVTRHTKIDEALQRSEEKYRSILEGMEEGYYEVDLKGNYTFVNDAVCRHQGRSRDEMIGMNNRDHTSPEVAKKIYRIYHEVYQTGIPAHIVDYEVIRKDGTPIILEISISLLRNASGKPIGFSGISRDVTEKKMAEKSLRESEERYRTILESIEDGYGETDERGRLVFYNNALTRMYRCTGEELLQMDYRATMDEDTAKLLREIYTKVYSTGEPSGIFHYKVKRKDGSSMYLESSITAIRNSEGRITGFRGVVRDITGRMRNEEALRRSEERYRTILESIEDGYYEVDLAGNLIFFNDALCRMYGYARDELTGINNRKYMNPETGENTYRIFNEVYRTGEPNRMFDWEFIKKDGSKIFVEVSASLVKDAYGKPSGFRGIVRDITARKMTEERLRYLANYDSLTGLLNRALFRDRLSHAAERARRQKGVVVVLFIDLDRFKSVNDTLGHEFGDKLLQAAARRIKGCLRDSDTIARLGGDEFIIMLEDIAYPERAVIVAKKILQSFVRPILVSEREIYTSASIGITSYPGDASDIDALLRNADSAMYLAKERGRNNYQFFTPEMNARAQERLLLESSLRRALEREEFILYYQPQVDIMTGGLTGFEVLLRWQHPDLGLLTPDKFIPIAEETGMIISMDEWVIKSACIQWCQWRDMGLPPVDMAVNISILQFRQKDLHRTLARIVGDTGMEPRHLELELTETDLMTNPDRSRETLMKLKESGIRCAIDDFGTGYSSLNYLKRFPIDTLKIDRSFIKDITTDPDDAAIVQAIISLGNTLRKDVVAEGVETMEQSDFLKSLNCHKAQGFLFSRPVPADSAVEWLKGKGGPGLTI
jgi:diguanylate cyclase (GGDEF)-like protein/PAS domain S-box-containing protein